jgi:AcrR family transcriptional regulator
VYTDEVEVGATKQRIVSRALQLASSDGLEALTIGRLADDLGMSKAGIYGHFGSKQALQLDTVKLARELFRTDVISPSEAAEDGLPRLWALCTTYLSCITEVGRPGGEFWVTVAHEYDSRSGPVRDAIETAMSGWMQRLEDLVSAAVKLAQLAPCDPAQVAFEVEALLVAGGHQYRLYRDPKAPARAKTAIRQRLEELRTPGSPKLDE